MTIRHLVKRYVIGVLFALGVGILPLLAQQYPARPIHLIVPFAAAGTPDVVARIVANAIEKPLGQPVIVEDRPGANGIIGMQDVAVAAPDGYTVMQTPPAFVINPYVYKKLPFDISRDFEAVANIGISYGYLVIVRPSLPVHSITELIDYAKSHRVLYGSPGVGNTLHLAAAYFGAKAGIDANMENVVFRDMGPMSTALIAGTIDLVFESPASAVVLLNSGMRPIGFTGTVPSPDYPNVPLVKDQLPGFEIAGSWEIVLAPAKTPDDIVTRLNAEIRAAVKIPSVKQGIEQAGYEPTQMSPAEVGTYLRDEAQRYKEAVQAAKIEPQ
jgi:tripartite-type tricarboxylate transporter receptor subunit TctC